jgi:hypothetical protein
VIVDWTAIATLILAGVTVLLVYATFKLASQAAQDTRAQWRPVLLARDAMMVLVVLYPEVEMPEGAPTMQLMMTVENVGRGPALDVAGVVTAPTERQPSDNISAIAPGATATVSFDLVVHPGVLIIRLSYTDISRVGHGTAVYLGMVDDGRNLPVLFQAVESHQPIGPWRKRLTPRSRRPLHAA